MSIKSVKQNTITVKGVDESVLKDVIELLKNGNPDDRIEVLPQTHSNENKPYDHDVQTEAEDVNTVAESFVNVPLQEHNIEHKPYDNDAQTEADDVKTIAESLVDAPVQQNEQEHKIEVKPYDNVAQTEAEGGKTVVENLVHVPEAADEHQFWSDFFNSHFKNSEAPKEPEISSTKQSDDDEFRTLFHVNEDNELLDIKPVDEPLSASLDRLQEPVLESFQPVDVDLSSNVVVEPVKSAPADAVVAKLLKATSYAKQSEPVYNTENEPIYKVHVESEPVKQYAEVVVQTEAPKEEKLEQVEVKVDESHKHQERPKELPFYSNFWSKLFKGKRGLVKNKRQIKRFLQENDDMIHKYLNQLSF